MAYRASIAKSIQRGSITLGANVLSNTATLSTSVTTTNRAPTDLATTAAVRVIGMTTANGTNEADSNTAFVTLTNATTVTAARGAAHADAVVLIVYFEVVERFASDLRQNVQHVTLDMTGVITKDATITAVVLAKSELFYRGVATTGQTAASATFANTNGAANITATTTVTGKIGDGGTGTRTLYASVLEAK